MFFSAQLSECSDSLWFIKLWFIKKDCVQKVGYHAVQVMQ